jgi:lysozyme
VSSLILAAVAGVAALTSFSEGTKYKAYLDPIGKPTICRGHTKNVKLGQVATEKQCEQFFNEDMAVHIQEAVAVTPNLARHHGAMMAVGDLTFNGGIGAYKGSPIAAYINAGEFIKACNAFPTWYTGATYSKRQPKLKCIPHKKKPGKFLCELPGLVKRRLNEQKICLNGKW